MLSLHYLLRHRYQQHLQSHQSNHLRLRRRLWILKCQNYQKQQHRLRLHLLRYSCLHRQKICMPCQHLLLQHHYHKHLQSHLNIHRHSHRRLWKLKHQIDLKQHRRLESHLLCYSYLLRQNICMLCPNYFLWHHYSLRPQSHLNIHRRSHHRLWRLSNQIDLQKKRQSGLRLLCYSYLHLPNICMLFLHQLLRHHYKENLLSHRNNHLRLHRRLWKLNYQKNH